MCDKNGLHVFSAFLNTVENTQFKTLWYQLLQGGAKVGLQLGVCET